MDTAKLLLDYLNTENIVIKNTNAFIGPLRPPSDTIPDTAVFFRTFEGRSPGRTFDMGYEIAEELVNICVRTSVDDGYTVGQVLAQSIYDKLNRNDVTGALDVWAASPIVSLGYDNLSMHMFGLNFRVKVQVNY